MTENTSALVIIPAKTDSKRVKFKNLKLINNKTLVDYAIEYAKKSTLTKYIIVSTESSEVEKISKKFNGVLVYKRDEKFMGEREVADVYVDIMQNQLKKYGHESIAADVSHVVGIQPDHPDRTTNLDELLIYAVDNKYDDLVTVDASGTRNGAVRITKKEFVISGSMSRRIGSFLDDCTNIHSDQDILDAARNISLMEEKKGGSNE